MRTIDSGMFSGIIKSKPVNQHETLFYNNQFKVVASLNTPDINRTDITGVTRRLLEGNTGVVEDQGVKHGIGFSRMGEEALYISVKDVGQDTAQRISSFRKKGVAGHGCAVVYAVGHARTVSQTGREGCARE